MVSFRSFGAGLLTSILVISIEHGTSASCQAWCDHNQVPMEDAAFLLGTVVLKPEEIAAASGISCIAWCVGARQDTLHSLGCRDEEEVVVRAAGTLVSVASCFMGFR